MNNKIKRFPIKILMLLPVLTLCSCFGSHDDNEYISFDDQFSYKKLDYGVAVEGFNKGQECKYIFSSEPVYGPIVRINSGAFKGVEKLESLYFDHYCQDLVIEQEAFMDCPKLYYVIGGTNVREIHTNSFYNCDLKTLELDGTLIKKRAFVGNPRLIATLNNCTIDKYGFSYSLIDKADLTNCILNESAFENAINLTSVSGLLDVSNYAFKNCTSLNSISFDDTVGYINIGEGAFENCTNLKDIFIPGNVTNIASDAFKGCSGVTFHVELLERESDYEKGWNNDNKVIYGSVNKSILDHGLKYREMNINGETSYSLYDCVPHLLESENVIIPDKINGIEVRYIEDYAFRSSNKIKSIFIPNTLKHVYGNAFKNLNDVTIFVDANDDSLVFDKGWNNNNAVIYNSTGRLIHDSGSTYVEVSQNDDKSLILVEVNSNLNKVVIKNEVQGLRVKRIASNAINRLNTLQVLEIPQMDLIDSHAINNCPNLEIIRLGSGIVRIDKHAINNCRNALIISDVKTKPVGWHEYMSSGNAIITGYNNMEVIIDNFKVVVGENETGLYGVVLKLMNNDIKNVYVPKSINLGGDIIDIIEISGYTFTNNNTLETIHINNNVKVINENAIVDCLNAHVYVKGKTSEYDLKDNWNPNNIPISEE